MSVKRTIHEWTVERDVVVEIPKMASDIKKIPSTTQTKALNVYVCFYRIGVSSLPKRCNKTVTVTIIQQNTQHPNITVHNCIKPSRVEPSYAKQISVCTGAQAFA